MYDHERIESLYQTMIESLQEMIHENVLEINLELLHELGLLDSKTNSKLEGNEFSFHVQESEDKITLYNERFILWIIPKVIEHQPITYAIVSLNRAPFSGVELIFSAQGVYNSSKIVLKVLSYYLKEIVENESMLDGMSNDLHNS